MIPLSRQIDKYRRIVEEKGRVGKPCDIIHIVKLDTCSLINQHWRD